MHLKRDEKKIKKGNLVLQIALILFHLHLSVRVLGPYENVATCGLTHGGIHMVKFTHDLLT